MTQDLLLVPPNLPQDVDSLQSYMQRIHAIPVLTEEEERDLAYRFRQEGDLQAAQQLVLSHLRYVAKVARSYSGYGLSVADLIQEGTIGLMKAVKRFDPDHGVRLVSFAVHWIKSEIHEFIIRNWRIVKVATTKAQRKLFFNIRKSKKRLGWFTAQEVKEVAQDLGVTPKDVLEMEARLTVDEAFDLGESDDDEHAFSPSLYLKGPTQHEPEQIVMQGNVEQDSHAQLRSALETLDERSLDIVSNRWLSEEKMPLKDLAQKYQVSIERVRQLEKMAIEKLKNQIDA